MILREPAHALDPRMRTVWALEGAMASGVLALTLAVAVGVLATVDAGTTTLVVGVVGALLVLASAAFLVWLRPKHDHAHFRFEVTELGLYVARGWLLRRWQVVPHARVQTVDTTAGPLLRAFGLVAVQVTTAAPGGGTGIPGLEPRAADALVEELARRAGVEEGT